MFDRNEQTVSIDKRWVTGEIFGLEIPADAETLVSNGTERAESSAKALDQCHRAGAGGGLVQLGPLNQVTGNHSIYDAQYRAQYLGLAGEQKRYMEPSAGAGAMIIASADTLRTNGLTYQ